jgi:hypothetical protein
MSPLSIQSSLQGANDSDPLPNIFTSDIAEVDAAFLSA